MNYNIKGANVTITNELRAYIEKRLQHAEKFLRGDPNAYADVELEFAESERGQKYRAEITLMHDGEMYRSSKQGDSMHAAIDMAGEDVARELARMKKKKIHLLRHSAGRVKDFLRGFRKSV